MFQQLREKYLLEKIKIELEFVRLVRFKEIIKKHKLNIYG
jgi:hypothetical protein